MNPNVLSALNKLKQATSSLTDLRSQLESTDTDRHVPQIDNILAHIRRAEESLRNPGEETIDLPKPDGNLVTTGDGSLIDRKFRKRLDKKVHKLLRQIWDTADMVGIIRASTDGGIPNDLMPFICVEDAPRLFSEKANRHISKSMDLASELLDMLDRLPPITGDMSREDLERRERKQAEIDAEKAVRKAAKKAAGGES